MRTWVLQSKPSKHLSWWRRTKDDLKTSWRRLSVTLFYLPRRLQGVLKTSLRHNCKTSFKHVLKASMSRKTSWRHLEDVLGRRIANTFWRRLEDVLEDEKVLQWRRLQDVLKTPWKTRNVCWEILCSCICVCCESGELGHRKSALCNPSGGNLLLRQSHI